MFVFKKTHAFLGILALNLILLYLLNKIVFTDSFFYSTLNEQFSYNTISEIITLNKKIAWLSYAIFPIVYLLKITCISFIIFIGINLFEIKLFFDNCFKIVLLAESVPLLGSITKTLYFYIYPPNNSDIIHNFNPLGLSSLFKSDAIPKYLLYPLQQFNLFEVAYWLLLAYGIKSLGNMNYINALKITSLSYGVGLLIWCIFIVFLQLQFS